MTQPGRHRRGSGPLGGVGTVIVGVIAGFVVVALLVVMGAEVFGQNGHKKPPAKAVAPPTQSTTTTPVIPVPHVSQAVLDKLPLATTEGKVPKAVINLTAPSGGRTLEISRNMPGFARPGADPIVLIPNKQIGMTTWLPVIHTRAGWAQVRLPARPNGATAWVPMAGLNEARTDWSVLVNLSAGTLTVRKAGHVQGSWSVGQGQRATPTPTGQTFLLSGFVDPTQTFSPIIYALGAHSNTLDSFGGGPGTVAVHGWPTAAGRHGYVSHGCVRVPAAALKMFAKLPTGTPVDIVT
ncbi:L,D-transpeptidase [Flexivirga caeni]|uniref:Murein L,D-transpeptidase n=1 Tax=Flexivirga caeni TaxID=2294115 RepID=A0A3M9MIT3_9MICO|nr:L,D-transpeptidase [Flexivirga caeni]RNI25416.1 murein L,D-transpeptidase [Flexivirga caeni]